MTSSSNRPSFLTFNGKKYHPSLEWNDEEGLPHDPKTHAPHFKMDFKVSFFFFFGKFVDFMLHWKFGVEILSFDCCLLFVEILDIVGLGWKFWLCCNLGLGVFLNCWVFFFFFFWHGVTRTILMAHEFWQSMSCGIVGWI